MEKFIDSTHCVSRVHCQKCRSSLKWRQSMANVTIWDKDYTCPLHLPIIPETEESSYAPEPISEPAQILNKLNQLMSQKKKGCHTCGKKK